MCVSWSVCVCAHQSKTLLGLVEVQTYGGQVAGALKCVLSAGRQRGARGYEHI